MNIYLYILACENCTLRHIYQVCDNCEISVHFFFFKISRCIEGPRFDSRSTINLFEVKYLFAYRENL